MENCNNNCKGNSRRHVWSKKDRFQKIEMIACHMVFKESYNKMVKQLIEGRDVSFEPCLRSQGLSHVLLDLGVSEEVTELLTGLPLLQSRGRASSPTSAALASLFEGCPQLASTPGVQQHLQNLRQLTCLPELNLEDPAVRLLLDCGVPEPSGATPPGKTGPRAHGTNGFSSLAGSPSSALVSSSAATASRVEMTMDRGSGTLLSQESVLFSKSSSGTVSQLPNGHSQ